MKTDQRERLRAYYDGLCTDELLELHAAGTLTDEAYEVLESVLVGRSVPVPERPHGQDLAGPHNRVNPWVIGFSAVGFLVPILCIARNFQPTALMRLCEFIWPSAFLLLAADGHFNIAIYSVSILINGVVWGCLGWLVDRVLSGGLPWKNG